MILNAQQFGEGRPLVILHGLLGSSDNWQTMARRFADRFHVCALDLRNHGGSPHAGSMTLEELADDVAETAAALKLERICLLGHSLGGKVAMTLALARPELVDRLVVADIAPKAYTPRYVGLLKLLAGLDLSTFRNRTEIVGELEPALPNLAFRQWLVKNLGTSPAGGLAWKVNLLGLLENYPGLTAALSGGRQFVGKTLLLRGGKSDYVDDADEASTRELFPNLESRTIAGAGHWLHAEAPGDFYEICSEFFG